MRVSIPPGTVINGKTSSYVIDRIVGLSERTTTFICNDYQGHKLRLKIFDGENSLDNTSSEFFEEVKIRGLEPLVDSGMYSGYSFYVFKNYNVPNIDMQVIPPELLAKRVIPQISYVVNSIHSKRYLIRDIDTKHVLFDLKSREILFTGLSNFVKLQGKATATKEPGYGQHYSYIAPEVEQYGYSFASDYFSLGVFFLSIIKGQNILADLSKNEFINIIKKGTVPGIDIEYFKGISPNLFSQEDRILYLILGLMLPDPNQRWGYGEIRCWCNNQVIPLVRSGKKVIYQYNKPLLIGNVKCWNDYQIGECLASSSLLWTKKTHKDVIEYLKIQNSLKASVVEGFGADDDEKTQIFKTIYTLNPTVNGFAWNGKKYKDTYELVNAAKNKNISAMELSSILRNECLSFFHLSRVRNGLPSSVEIQKIKELEKQEKVSQGEGASRCLVLFSPNKQSRFFEFEGKQYTNISEMLTAYKGNELRLKKNSSEIVKNPSFQAWLWSKGYEKTGKEALKAVNLNPKNSFLILLSVLEKCEENELQKKLIRELFIKYGDLAPIAWLFSNVQHYNNVSQINTVLYDRFRGVRVDLNKSVQELNIFLSEYVQDYQLFVQNTLDNPFILEYGQDDTITYDFAPKYETFFFCERWNDFLEVSPAFLYCVGETIEVQRVKAWLNSCGDQQRDILQRITNGLDVKDTSEASVYLHRCQKNINAATIVLIVSTILLIPALSYSIGLAFLSYTCVVIFPILSLTWYHKRKARAEIWYRTYRKQSDKKSSLDTMLRSIKSRENDIYTHLVNHVHSLCVVKSDNEISDSISLNDPETLELSTGQKVFAYISTFGAVLLITTVLGNVYSSFISACIYAIIYGIVVPCFFRRKFVKSCSVWSIVTAIVSGATISGGLWFGSTFLVTMIWIPIIALVILAIILFLYEFFY